MLAALLMFCMLAACNDSTSDSNVKKIGVMQFAEFDALQKAYDGFVDGLKEAGYEDGKNIEITKLSAAADTANCPTIADTLINNGSDLDLCNRNSQRLRNQGKDNNHPRTFHRSHRSCQIGLRRGR